VLSDALSPVEGELVGQLLAKDAEARPGTSLEVADRIDALI